MAKDVVAVLEIVDIDERHGNGGVLLPELLEGTGKAAAVAKSGELVGKGRPNQIILALEKVTDGLFERFGVIADSIHVLSGFLRSGADCVGRARSVHASLLSALRVSRPPPCCVVGLFCRLMFAVDNC